MHQHVGAAQAVNLYLLTVGQLFGLSICQWLCHQQEYVLYGLASPHLAHDVEGGLEVTARQETVDFFSHGVNNYYLRCKIRNIF
jgi:hypothetical protein